MTLTLTFDLVSSVVYPLWFTLTLTLTSDLVLKIIVSGAYLLYYLSYKSQIWCVCGCILGLLIVLYNPWVNITLT